MTGFKDLQECGRVRHGEILQLKQRRNGKYSLIGINTCKKPICPNCLKILLKKQEKSIFQAMQYAQENNLCVTMWTINLPKNQNQSLMLQRIKLHEVISDFLRTSTRDSKTKPVNKILREINKNSAVGYIYRNEVSYCERFNPHIHLADFRKISLTEVQKDALKESLIEICKRNGVFISVKQSYSVRDVILNFKDDFNIGYLTKISDCDAVKLKETNSEKYQEYCESQIFLNSQSNSKIVKIPLVYWKVGFKKLVGIREEIKDDTEQNYISIPTVIADYMSFHKIEPKKLLHLIDSVGIEILEKPNIFGLLQSRN